MLELHKRKTRRQSFLVFIAAGIFIMLTVAFIAFRTIPLHLHDDFESSKLSWRWTTIRLEPGCKTKSSVPVIKHSPSPFTLATAMKQPATSALRPERDELMENWGLFSRIGRTYVYSFSLYLPDDLPSNANRLVIAQWCQLCEARQCRPDYPILAVRYQKNLLEITREDDQGRHILYQTGDNVKAQWLDFRFEIKFDARVGHIQATFNRARVVDYQGPTLFSLAPGYPANGTVYFKTGIYRDALNNPPWTIYVDDYRKDECPSAGCQ